MVVLFIFINYCSFSQNSIIEHKIKSGETLSKISLTYDIPLDDLKEFNGLTDDLIFVGQILSIPPKDDYKPIENLDYLNNLDLEKRIIIRNIYYSQIDVRELTGNNDGIMVEKYLNSTGLGKGYPWCAAFVYWTLRESDINITLQYPAWVPSYFPDNKLIYVRGKLNIRPPVFGDLIGIWFESKNRLAHIGFYDGENSNYYFTVEGNTNEAGSREGDGVYRKRRIKRQVHSISSWIEN